MPDLKDVPVNTGICPKLGPQSRTSSIKQLDRIGHLSEARSGSRLGLSTGSLSRSLTWRILCLRAHAEGKKKWLCERLSVRPLAVAAADVVGEPLARHHRGNGGAVYWALWPPLCWPAFRQRESGPTGTGPS